MPDTQTPTPAATRIFDQYAGETEAPVVETPQVQPDSVERDPKTGRWLKPGFSGHLVAKARQLGFTDEDLKEMSGQDLRDEIRAREFDTKIEKVFNLKETAARLAEPSKMEQPQAFDHGVTESDFDPKLVAGFNKMKEHYEAKIAALEKEVGGVKQYAEGQAKRERESYAKRIERCFAKYPDVFGPGKIEEISQDDPEFAFRIAANKYHLKSGGDSDELEANIDKFVTEKFARKSPERTEVDEASEWEQGVLGTPSQAGPREDAPGREKAVQGVKRVLTTARDSKPLRGNYLNHNRSQNGQGK